MTAFSSVCSLPQVHATASRGEAFGDGEGERDKALADARVTLPGVDGHPYHVVMTLVQLLTPAAGMLEAYVDDGAGGTCIVCLVFVKFFL